MSDIRVKTVPDEFEVPEDYLGVVTRNGVALHRQVKARDWLVGDEVQCLLRWDGKLMPVRFIVAEVVAC